MVWLRRNPNANNDVDPETIPFEEGLITTVDRQLQELGFSNLCARIANKFKDEVEKIAVEQREIRTHYEKLNGQISEMIANGGVVPERSPAVIVIDDDDDDDDVQMVETSKNTTEQGKGISPTSKQNVKKLPNQVGTTPQGLQTRKTSSLSQRLVITSQGCYVPDGATQKKTLSSSKEAEKTISYISPKGPVVSSSSSVLSGSQAQTSESSVARQVISTLSQKAEALAKGINAETLLPQSGSASAPSQVTASTSSHTNSSVTWKNTGGVNSFTSLPDLQGSGTSPGGPWQQASSPVARKRPGLVVGHDQTLSKTGNVRADSPSTSEGSMRLRSKTLLSGTTSSNLANDILKSKAITLSEPILKLTPIPVPPSSQPQGSSSESSSKTDSPAESPATTPHPSSPPPEGVGLKNLFSGALSPTNIHQKVQEAAKTKKSERYVIKFKEGLQVLGKPEKSDMWYPGIIEKVTSGRKGLDKYLVKFDSKNNKTVHGQLPVNHLAPVFYPDARDLNVGSRVVATRPGDTVDSRLKNKYKDITKSKADILFGGIIAELACEENRNRYLIFFDDGFAQYLSLRKLRHVVYASTSVWEDVSVHCRDFCKEYLQEYPFRPMVKLKVGEIINTEWNGKWLNAKIIGLDGSLVKVLFDIDQRTEWIYRGSTRLEPLYTELERRDQHAALLLVKNANKSKQKRKGRGGTEEDDTELEPNPRIEDRITKPTFGVSKFSLKDPEGNDQWKNWEKEMSAKEKEAHVAKALGIQRVTYFTSPQGANTTSSPAMVQSKTDIISSETDTTIVTVEREVESQSQEEETPIAPEPENTTQQGQDLGKGTKPEIEKETMKKVEPVAPPKATVSSTKPPNPGSALTTSAVRASRSMRGKAPVIPYGAATKEAEATWEAPWLKPRKRSHNDQSSVTKVPVIEEPTATVTTRSKNAASLLQEKLARTVGRKGPDSPPSDNEGVTTVFNSVPSIRGPHKCTGSCCPIPRLPESERRKHNPLLIPLLSGWMRETAKRRPGYRRDVYYRTPCYRRLRSLSNVAQYLLETRTQSVTIDQFCFDPTVSCREFNPKMLHPRTKIEDLSRGKETVEISCVNENTNEYPPVVEYVNKTIVADGVNINMETDYLVCCDCTDLCQDKSKCSCCQLTVAASAAITGIKDENAGYSSRRLAECVTAGIYECNSRCACSSSCFNRVVQNGIQARLQIFMTGNKGWGLRCLDDIPKGAFICCYAGQILTEEMANKEGKDFGDEYLAELDHIEVVEQAKEGYESDVPELRETEHSEKVGSNPTSEEGSSKDDDSFDDDSDSYSTCTDSSGSDESYQPDEEDIEPLLKKKKLEDSLDDLSQTETSKTTDAPADPTGREVIDLTADSDDDLEKGKETLPKPMAKESKILQESSLQHIIRRLVTCVNESKRAASAERSMAFYKQGTNASKEDTKVTNSTTTAQNSDEAVSKQEVEPVKNEIPEQVAPDVTKVEVDAKVDPVESKERIVDDALDKTSDRQEGTDSVAPEGSEPCPMEVDTNVTTTSHSDAVATSTPLLPMSVTVSATVAPTTSSPSKASAETVSTTEQEKKETDDEEKRASNKEDRMDATESKPQTPRSETPRKDNVTNVLPPVDGNAMDVDSIPNEKSSAPATVPDAITITSPPSSQTNEQKSVPVETSSTDNTEMKTVASSTTSDPIKPPLPVSGKLITKKGSASLTALLAGSKKTRAFALKSTGGQGAKLFSSPRSSTGGHMPRKGMNVRSNPLQQSTEKAAEEGQPTEPKNVSTRLLYGEDSCYVIDAKSFGNAGRYLNHSCSPNLFVQNVFIETHDLRFPTVAFFALQNIPALQELTWDYSYEVGSVPGKVIYCRCGSGECRMRLL